MRQLSSGGRVRHDIVRELRALRSWVAALRFPSGPFEGQGYYNWKLPMHQALVSPPLARQRVQAAISQVLIDTAERLAGQKPKGLEQTRVLASISSPSLFSSEICIFFDRDYLASFCVRNGDDHRWTPEPDRSLVDRLDLSLPTGFDERGFQTFYRDGTFDPPYIEQGEIWLIGETE